jgi:hypothetical protein
MARIYERITAALLWIAAFCFASGVFFAITLLFRSLPPTAPVAIGVVTIERYSKLKDYLGAAIFFLAVPPLTIWFRGIGARFLAREQRRFDRRREQRQMPVAVLFTAPFLLSPLFYLTTGKAGWILLLPVAIAFGATRALLFFDTRRWLRQFFRRELNPYHALLFCEALSWILFRYLVTGRRIGHFPTLFLETVFVAIFLVLFWVVAFLIARLTELNFGLSGEDVFRGVVSAALPMVLLPVIPIVTVPARHPAAVMITALLIIAALALGLRNPISPGAARTLAAIVVIPVLIYLVSYASTAHLLTIDLFHRGESIGPASDYLRGKAPYRGVFPLHGMLEDGLLDAWLMKLFGRSLDVAMTRTVVLGAFLSVAIWYLGLAIFESIPLALLTVATAAWTTTENNRTFFQVAVVALLWIGLKRRWPVAVALSGFFAGLALFFSYEIGLYSIVGALVSIFLLRLTRTTNHEVRDALAFSVGLLIGCAPFVIYLIARGVLRDFATVSFVTIPRVIDAVWSLPFPDLVSTFRKNLNLHTLAEFVLFEKFHLILSPLTIAVAAIYLIQRAVRRRIDRLDCALLVLTVFATITQRTAFGRAEFRHQYFSAFLIGPMLVILAVVAIRRLRQIWMEGDPGTRAFVSTVVLLAIPIFGVLFWVPDLINVRIDDLANYQRRALHLQRDPYAEEVAFRIDQVSKAIREFTRPNDPIFDFSNQPAFYFFADRPNPTRFYQVPIMSPRVLQAEVIAALQAARPGVVIRTSPENFDEFDGVPNAIRAQGVAAYLDDCYRYYRSVRGVQVWIRDPRARPAPLQSYLRRIQLPDEKALAASERASMVFPLIGSAAGATNSFWISDLTLHNPFRDPISVSLRFIAGQRSVDRNLTLAPRQTIRWPDVVRTYFGLQEIGTLWIEHREGRAPVALVQNSDIAHEGRASMEPPLTLRDAITAGSDVAESTIVGIPAHRALGSRINIGVVNLGRIPATFRISAWSRGNVRVGRLVESGVPEEEVWWTNNIERELGIAVDETMTLRVTAIAGTGAAFATVVEPDGDSHFLTAVPSGQL